MLPNYRIDDPQMSPILFPWLSRFPSHYDRTHNVSIFLTFLGLPTVPFLPCVLFARMPCQVRSLSFLALLARSVLRLTFVRSVRTFSTCVIRSGPCIDDAYCSFKFPCIQSFWFMKSRELIWRRSYLLTCLTPRVHIGNLLLRVVLYPLP
jgi:hypothetical protein